MAVTITNKTRGTSLASGARLADSFLSRLMGLMGRRRLDPGGGLILHPNNSVHMLFMRFPLDIVFLDREGRVVGMRPNLRPWVGLAWCSSARTTLELPAGTIAASSTRLGDQLELSPALT